MTCRTVFLAVVCVGTFSVDIAWAQRMRAVVIEPAPVYLLPDATRTPLRTLPVGMELMMITRQGDWLRVEFDDPQFGARVGWIEAKRVRLEGPVAPPVEPVVEPPQTPLPATPGQAPPPGLGARVYGTWGGVLFAAKDTFEAVAGSRTFTSFGGGGTVTGLWGGLFVDVGFSRSTVDGERVFVDGSTAYPLGIPLQVTVTPIDIAGGWRVTQGRVSTFVGGGITSLLYEETDPFSDPGEDVNERKVGPLALLGVDVEIVRWVFVGGELRYRAVSGILGETGASHAFGEDEAGGFSAAVRVSFGR